MTEDIKFSVTVPAYKAQFLSECIDSILAQTYKNFEVIIVNDASPHDLDSIVKKYDDPRIHYYKNKVGFGAEHVVGSAWSMPRVIMSSVGVTTKKYCLSA